MSAQRRDTNDELDPLHAEKVLSDTDTRVALAGHPIHAMLVAFPISLTMCTLGADLFYWWTGDVFWARAALWAIGAAFLMGLLAGLSGTVELLMVPGIRTRRRAGRISSSRSRCSACSARISATA